MKLIIPLLRHLTKPAMVICLTCLLAAPLLANESANAKLEQARAALTGDSKDTVQAKKLLLDIVEHDKDTLDSKSLCYVYVYLGYIEDRAGNRNEAIPWYRKALEIKDADRVRECATYGMEKPLLWIRHLDEGAGEISLQSAPPVVVKTVPVAGATDVDPALAEIRVTYSKPMQNDSWSWSTWGEENYPETTGKPQYLSDGRTCVLPVKLKPDKFYAIWLNSEKFKNFKDAGGKPAVPYLLTFSTKGQSGQNLQQQQQPDANNRQQSLHKRFWTRTAQDQEKYTPQQLSDAEQLYQVANKQWGTLEAIENLQTVIKKYPDINRAGCATLYLAQLSQGDEHTRYLQDCIEKYDDCFYGDGVQVGAYARFMLAEDYKSQGQTEKAEALLNEIKTKYPDAVGHDGNLLLGGSEEDYISQQIQLVKAGNRWAQFNLWDAYYHGAHGVHKDRAKADQWLGEFVKGVYVVRFEPANGFNPHNAMDYLNDIRKHTPQIISAQNGIGTGGFFRTKKTGGKLVASFLTEEPDKLKTYIESNPDLKFVSAEAMTPQMFIEYDSSPQESL